MKIAIEMDIDLDEDEMEKNEDFFPDLIRDAKENKLFQIMNALITIKHTQTDRERIIHEAAIKIYEEELEVLRSIKIERIQFQKEEKQNKM